jgi:hypothetical protein
MEIDIPKKRLKSSNKSEENRWNEKATELANAKSLF